MSSQRVSISLDFQANTEQAKAKIQDLYSSLGKVYSAPNFQGNAFGEQDIKKASQAALELSQHLQRATDVNTGKLDLSRFSASLKASGKDLNNYYDTLLKAGPDGEKAFLKVAEAVATAEAPTARLNKQFQDLWITMKNTAKWQLSSSVMHGFMSSVSKAYNYAQDLNESLNNIRIVTGNSADQMARFAKEANKAARQLSTTTTEYTNASLIYYQQGLDDQQVKERTDVTIKLANVTGESAQAVSNQMTAIWNNFADGSHTIEYYADVITALGAATASSTDEISAGLEKFAGIAETVGLSYEYATAALATITAESREAPETVGTALKTIFARVQGLKLGETLEDGVDLNKYSVALAKVGVDVIDANGQLIEMDTILNQLADKWQTLEKSEQAALAQTVAGVRQYNQLMTLMNNWDDMEKNLGIASGAEGALSEQAKIYEESWQAASKRVKAAAEGIYDSLINDDAFIFMLNGLEKVLNLIGGLVDGFGGLGGVIAMVGSIFMRNFSKEIPGALQNIKQNFLVLTGQAQKMAQEEKKKNIKKLEEVKNDPSLSVEKKAKITELTQIAMMENNLEINRAKMSQDEIAAYELKIELAKKLFEENKKLTIEADKQRKGVEQDQKDLENSHKRLAELREKDPEEMTDEDRQELVDLEAFQRDARVKELRSKKAKGEILEGEEAQELDDLEAELRYEEYQRIKEKQKSGKKLSANETQVLGQVSLDEEKYKKKAERSRIKRTTGLTQEEYDDFILLEELERQGLIDRQDEKKLAARREKMKNAREKQILSTEDIKKQSGKVKSDAMREVISTDFSSFSEEEKTIEEDLKNDEQRIRVIKDKGESERTDQEKKELSKREARQQRLKKELEGVTDEDEQKKRKNKFITKEALSQMDDSELKKFAKIQQQKAKVLQKSLKEAGFDDSKIEGLNGIINLKEEDFQDLDKLKEKLAELKEYLSSEDMKIDLGDVSLPPDTRQRLEEQIETISQQIDTQASSDQVIEEGPEIEPPDWSEVAGEAATTAMMGAELVDSFSNLSEVAGEFSGNLADSGGVLEALAGTAGVVYGEFQNVTSLAEKLGPVISGLGTKLSAMGPIAAKVGSALTTMTGPIGIAIALLAAVAGIAVKMYINSQKALDEAVVESADALNEGKEKAAEIESEIESINDTIAEMNGQKLDIVDQTELANLETRRALLESQLALQKAMNLEKAKEHALALQEKDEKGNEPTPSEKIADAGKFSVMTTSADGMSMISQEFDASTMTAEEAARLGVTSQYEAAKSNMQQTAYEESGALSAEITQLMTDIQTMEENGIGAGDAAYDAATAMLDQRRADYMEIEKLAYGDNQEGYQQAQREKLENAVAASDELTMSYNEETGAWQFNQDFLDKNLIDSSVNENLASLMSILGDNGFDVSNLKGNQIMDLLANQEGIERLGNTSQHGIMGYDLKQYGGNIDNLLADVDNRTPEEKRASADRMGENAAKSFGLDPEEFAEYRDLLYEAGDAAQGITEEIKKNPKLLNEMAVQLKRNIEGTENLAENWGKFSKALNSKDLNEIAKIWPDMRKNLADITGLDYSVLEQIPATFAQEHSKEIQDYIDGVEGAGYVLEKLLMKEYIMSIKIDPDNTGAIEARDKILKAIDELPELKVGMTFDDDSLAPLMSALEEAAMMGTMTADQINASLSGITSDTVVTTQTFTVIGDPTEVDGYYDYEVLVDPQTRETEHIKLPITSSITPEGGKLTVPSINGKATVNQVPDQKVGSGGGGGGGGGNKTTRSSTSKSRYHKQINKKEDLSRKQAAKAAEADRAYGKQKLKNLKEQMEATQELIDVQQEYVDLISQDYEIDRQNLEDQWKVFKDGLAGIGVTLPMDLEIDKDGVVENWSEISEALIPMFNNLGTEEQKTYEELEKTFKEFFDLYHTTHDLYQEEQQALKELRDSIIDTRLTMIQTSIDLNIEIEETDLKWIEYQLGKIEDRAFSGAEAIALMNEQMSHYRNQSDIYEKGIKDTIMSAFKTEEEAKDALNKIMAGNFSGLDEVFTDDQIQALKGYADSLMTLNENMMELRKNAIEKLSEAFEEYNEKFDNAMSKIEHYNNLLNSFKDIVSITGKKIMGVTTEIIQDLNNTIVEGSIGSLEAAMSKNELSQKELQIANENLAKAEEALAKAEAEGNSALIDTAKQDVELWTKEAQTASEGAQEAAEALLDAWATSLEAAVTKFEESVENAVKDFDELLGGEDFDNDYSKQQEMSEFYLKDYEKIYELSKMTRQINKSIDDTKSIAGKQKLKSLLQDINDIQEKGLEMTEYDLEYMQKEYDLRLAQIALEEAQNAKETVRLQKDSEGNYSYVYTANTDKVEEAQQKYEDVLYEMQDLSSEHMNELGQNIIDLKNKMKEEILALDVSEFESQEEYEQAMKDIEDYYMGLIQMNNAQIDQTILNNKDLYETDIKNWEYATGEKQKITEDFVLSYRDTILGMLTGSSSDTSDFGEFIGNAAQALQQTLIAAFEEYISDVNKINETISTKDVSEIINIATEEIKAGSSEALDSVETLSEEIPNQLNELIPKIQTFADQYADAMAPAIKANEDLIITIGAMVKALTGEELNTSELFKTTWEVTEKKTDEPTNTDVPKENKETGAASGGYTGEWSDGHGRLLWVHPEELILNPDDTVNMVEALKITKEILQVIDLNARQASLGVGTLYPSTIKEEKQILEQQVTITAEFPNVQDKNEIQEAFNNLINAASQYANRK